LGTLFLTLIGFLVLFPLLTGALLLVVRNEKARTAVVVASTLLIMAGAFLLAALYLNEGSWQGSAGSTGSGIITFVTIAIDVLIAVYILVKSIKYKKPLAAGLAVAQMLVIGIFELTVAHGAKPQNDLYLDGLSMIMVLVIGIIGGGICIYALGYMTDFQEHAREHDPQAADRRPVFFALMFLFLSAMFGIVFSNNLSWLLCAWEITTVCSFALIGYTRTTEAIDNSFRQIVMNLLGGLAFALALFYLGGQGVFELDVLISQGSMGAMTLPIALIAFAGMTKAAQIPFQSWLLGAMVAPTPTSALLHSSTMVKAGVFILIKLAPTLGWNGNGLMVMLVGGLTFLFCSAIAITQSNAKRVLAYSTIANLGLIVTCAGVGTPAAVWAAIFLLIFHAAAKSLLFLCVGCAEHQIGSRDIEDMDNLFIRMPMLARLMALGILAMFAAPFGMLISKWAVIASLAESGNITLLIILAFGSAVTFMFWAKWLGKLLAIAHQEKNVERRVRPLEWAALILMVLLVVALSVNFPFISEYVVVPYLDQLEMTILPSLTGSLYYFWSAGSLGLIDFNNLLIMALVASALIISLIVLPGSFMRSEGTTTETDAPDAPDEDDQKTDGRRIRRKAPRVAPIYLGGVGLDFKNRTYRNSLSGESQASQRNWYMEGLLGEKSLTPTANTMCIVILVLGLVLGLASLGGWSL
jgi:ech hydrogenase subunit A